MEQIYCRSNIWKIQSHAFKNVFHFFFVFFFCFSLYHFFFLSVFYFSFRLFILFICFFSPFFCFLLFSRYTHFKGKTIKLFDFSILSSDTISQLPFKENVTPGDFIYVKKKKKIYVLCKEGWIGIQRLQIPSRGISEVYEFMNIFNLKQFEIYKFDDIDQPPISKQTKK